MPASRTAQGFIADRTCEHLGPTDIGIVRFRRLILGSARNLADGPWFAHAMTKKMLDQEWAMGIEEIIESEAQAQAICMATGDFRRAFEAFAAKTRPAFEGT